MFYSPRSMDSLVDIWIFGPVPMPDRALNKELCGEPRVAKWYARRGSSHSPITQPGNNRASQPPAQGLRKACDR